MVLFRFVPLSVMILSEIPYRHMRFFLMNHLLLTGIHPEDDLINRLLLTGIHPEEDFDLIDFSCKEEG